MRLLAGGLACRRFYRSISSGIDGATCLVVYASTSRPRR